MRKHWILVVGILSLCAWLAPPILSIEYDAVGTARLLYWACQMLGLPYWAIDELLHVHPGITALFGIGVFGIIDWGAGRRSRRAQSRTA